MADEQLERTATPLSETNFDIHMGPIDDAEAEAVQKRLEKFQSKPDPYHELRKFLDTIRPEDLPDDNYQWLTRQAEEFLERHFPKLDPRAEYAEDAVLDWRIKTEPRHEHRERLRETKQLLRVQALCMKMGMKIETPVDEFDTRNLPILWEDQGVETCSRGGYGDECVRGGMDAFHNRTSWRGLDHGT